MTKMAKIDTLFISKTAEKLYPLGLLCIPYIREYSSLRPPPHRVYTVPYDGGNGYYSFPVRRLLRSKHGGRLRQMAANDGVFSLSPPL